MVNNEHLLKTIYRCHFKYYFRYHVSFLLLKIKFLEVINVLFKAAVKLCSDRKNFKYFDSLFKMQHVSNIYFLEFFLLCRKTVGIII